MKLLYIVPDINNEGGVARVLTIKTSYLIEKFGYEISVITQNDGNSFPFYTFNNKIDLHDIILKGNKIIFFKNYIKLLNDKINLIHPDIIVVCDNGLKAYTIPFIVKSKIPIIFESHNSKFLELNHKKNFFLSELKYWFRNYGASKFNKFIALSGASLKEWNLNNGIVIPNPSWNTNNKKSDLTNKKAIAVGRHVYEKGFDDLLKIWQKVSEKHSDWVLDIYGKSDENKTYEKLAKELKIDKNVNFYEPIQNIEDKYSEASVFLMTSKFEGFPMVLIEAIVSGLPCIAFDCPVGPRAIIVNNKNGFLIPESENDEFYNKLIYLIENNDLKIKMGQNALESSKKYATDLIMNQWNDLFKSLIEN